MRCKSKRVLSYLTSVVCAASLLGGCATFLDSDAYRDAEAVNRYPARSLSQLAPSLTEPAVTSAEFDRTTAATLVRRDHQGLYDDPVALITFLYAVRTELIFYSQLGAGIQPQFTDDLSTIQEFLSTRFTSTQAQPQFHGYPGDDPWGRARGNLIPEYKKLLPSEMIAMQMYTGRFTSKCTTIAAFIAGAIMTSAGGDVDPEDIVLLRMGGHTIGLWRIAPGDVVMFSNTEIGRLSVITLDYLRRQRFNRFLGLGFYAEGRVRVPDDLLTGEDTLRQMFQRSSQLDAVDIEPDPVLVDYALQRLDVPDPSLYLEVCRSLPHTQTLSRRLRTTQEMVQWISEHVADGSIFPNGADRVMTTDQVIVFRTGNAVDKALLLCSLLANNGQSAHIELIDGSLYVRTERELIDMSDL